MIPAVTAAHGVAPIPSPRRDDALRLRDGRMLGWAEYGDPRGRSVFYLHGALSSRLEAAELDATARALGIRLVAVDRPGIGRSTPIDRPSFTRFAEDVRDLADSLRIERFGLLGLSAGGAHAACIASRLPERVTALVLVSSVCPPGPGYAGSPGLRSLAMLARVTSLHLRLVAALLARMVRRRGASLIRDNARTPWDRRANELPHHAEIVAAAWIEGTRQGARHVASDARLLLCAWDVELRPPPCPVAIWHGAEDPTIPPSAARFFASAFPRAALHLVEAEGHTLLACRQAEILSSL
jgi:pimeloyl-ACP methyl ester carboxylesterase